MKKLSKVFENAGVLDPSQYTLKDGVLTIHDGVTEIPDYAFMNSRLVEITIPDSVREICEYAFADNKLTEVAIPDSVQEIEKYAFVGNNLTEVKLSENTTYNKSTFDDNVKIKNI